MENVLSQEKYSECCFITYTAFMQIYFCRIESLYAERELHVPSLRDVSSALRNQNLKKNVA
jgi:hypothetical protein